MQITVFGSNGKVGRLVTSLLLDSGHSVKAFVHNNSSLTDNKNLTLHKGDIYSSDDVLNAVKGSDAVISCLSSWHSPNKDILSSAMKNLIPAMKSSSVNRVITLTGSGAFYQKDKPNLFDKSQHSLMMALAKKVLADAEDHINLLETSSLDWTVLRSPVMTELGSADFKLQDGFPAPWATIHRHAVAKSLVELACSNDHIRKAPVITRS